MHNSSIHRIKQEQWWTHLLLLMISTVLSFTLLNIIFPLALYRPYLKLIIAAAGSITILATTYIVYDGCLRAILPDIKAHWLRNVIISLILTLLIGSLSILHLPYHPVVNDFQLKTSSPGFNLLGIGRQIKDGPYQRISWEEVQLEGDWEITGKGIVHTGESPATITYQRAEMVRSTLYYEFDISPAVEPTSARITIDGRNHIAEIPATGGQAPQINISTAILPSSSKIWHSVITVFPITARLSIFILLFCGLSWILAKQQPLPIKVLNSSLFAVIFFLFWITLNYQNNLLNFWSYQRVYPLIVATGFLGVPHRLNRWMQKKPSVIPMLLILVLILGTGIRIYWVLMVPTAQVSDFGKFHYWALQLANHESGLAIDRYANFTRTLSLLYRVFPTHVAVEVVNILLAAATSVGLYLIGKVNQHTRIGLLAAYWLALYPVHISMTSIVNTDIPATFLLVLSVLLVSLYVHQQKLVFLVLSGMIFAFCLFLRGAMLIYLPGIMILLFLQRKQKATYYLASSGLLLAVLLLTTSGLSAAIQQVKVADLTINESRYLMWPLVNGTNIESLGRNNPEDRLMVFSWSPEEINRKGFAVVRERIFSDPLGFYGLLKAKFEHLLANATYGADAAFLDENYNYRSFQTGWNQPINTIREGFAQVSQYAYLSILLLALIAVLKTEQDQITLWLPPLILLLCALGAYTFFEVQPRYSFPLIPFFLLLAGLAFSLKEEGKSA